MTKNEIQKILEEQYDFLIKKYNERQVLGIFVYGLSNYGLAERDDEVQTVACICPDFEDFCCQVEPLKVFYIKDDKERIIRITDIRLIYSKIIKQESVVLEAAFTDYKIINTRYKKIFNKYIFMNREIIFHSNQPLRVSQILSYGKKALERYKTAEIKNTEDLLKASYIRIACRQYINGVSCENCVNLKQDYYKNYLLQIKHGKNIPDIEEIEDDFRSLQEEANNLMSPTEDQSKLVKTAIVEVTKVSLTDMMQQTDFEDLLTQTEKQALDIILNNINDGHKGNISISQLTSSSGISRPVFKNVLQKMKDNTVAEIENQGVKGTYIKIIDGHLLSR